MIKLRIIALSILTLLIIFSFVEFGSRFANFTSNKILQERQELVDVNFSIQKEKDKNNTFWWIADSLNMISIINKSPKNLDLNLKMSLENNPCGFIGNFRIRKDSKVLIDYKNFDLGNNDIEIPIKIDKYKTINLVIEPIKPLTCTVINGDKRKFVAKMSNLKWEVSDRVS